MAAATVPGTNVTLLTVTSKMPSKSWSLPAFKACPSAYVGENARRIEGGRFDNVDKGTICGNCYAAKGMYVWNAVRRAQDARFKWTIEASARVGADETFVQTMLDAIECEARRQERKYIREIQTGERDLEDGYNFQPVFRVHDSGDLFSPAYTRLWQRICEATPDVLYWFPSRQHRSKNPHMVAALLALAALPNVSLRPSALRFGDAPPVIEGWAAGTSASAEGYNCPAYAQDGKCLDCRQCWTKDIPVIYRAH